MATVAPATLRYFVICGCLLSLPVAATAADWRVVATSTEPDLGRVIMFADVSSLQRSGNDVRVALEMRVERPPVSADGARTRLHADCGSMSSEVLGGDYYLGETVRGPHPVEPWVKSSPGSNMYVLLGNLCSGRYLSATVDPVRYAREQFKG